jgi:EAL domain-containing protein (putative c-di-GMP-specific phosphodiesterase class I)
VHTLVDLGKRLKLSTVAEWVQDEQTAKMLAEWGCDYVQGALVGLATIERPWRQGLVNQGLEHQGSGHQGLAPMPLRGA